MSVNRGRGARLLRTPRRAAIFATPRRNPGGLPLGPWIRYTFGVIARSTPSLRLARFFVENFRTFRERTEIPLSDGNTADPVATFHGPNGSGKSNALAALELFFRGAAMWLASGANPATLGSADRLRLPMGWMDEASGFTLNHRNWPAGSRDVQKISIDFEDPTMTSLDLVMTTAGNDAYVDLQERLAEPPLRRLRDASLDEIAQLTTRLLTPFGAGSTPFFRLNARRSHARTIGGFLKASSAEDSPLSVEMAARLYGFATSVEPEDTERWRAFTSLVRRFKTLDRRELSIVWLPQSPRTEAPFDLRFEIRGKQVLRLSELSSGEQQIVALCAAVLTSRASIVAIEEPEISLHPNYQSLLREILEEQVAQGLLDQVIIESHSPIFDSGPEVVHFSRTDEEIPTTHVHRVPAVEANPAIQAAARAAGARRHWVSKEGYTQLPPEMCKQMGLDQSGGHVWFLPEERGPAWRAWKEEDIDAVFGIRGEEPGE